MKYRFFRLHLRAASRYQYAAAQLDIRGRERTSAQLIACLRGDL